MLLKTKLRSKILRISYISLFTLLNIPLMCQDEISKNIFNQEKFSIEAGLGIENGVLGIRGKYFYSKYLGSSIGIGAQSIGLIWNIALETRNTNILTDNISPFLILIYGVNAAAEFEKPNGGDKTKLFYGFSASAGLKFNLIQKWNSYLSLGIGYRHIGNNVDQFIDSFNEENGTQYGNN